jgi:serine/threonine protein phosphatase 1
LFLGNPGPHESGKNAVVGHTSHKDGEELELGHLICIDTYCWGGGWLTALDVASGQIWQVDRDGRTRQ